MVSTPTLSGPSATDLDTLDRLIYGRRGRAVFVDARTGMGSDGNDGKSWSYPKATMASAFAACDNQSIVLALGKFTEQIITPQDLFGVKVVGMAGGQNRHADGDNILNGAAWVQAGVAGNAPLLQIREQGWEIEHFLFVPQATYSAIRINRAEIAANQDGSHCIIHRCKFIGPAAIGAQAGYGIEHWGGTHHSLVDECEFNELVCAITPGLVSDPGIAAPLRNEVRGCTFQDNTHDIKGNWFGGRIHNNYFLTPGAGGHTVINLAVTSDGAGVNGINIVVDNFFYNGKDDIDPAHGFTGATGDYWSNFTTDLAARVFGIPA